MNKQLNLAKLLCLFLVSIPVFADPNTTIADNTRLNSDRNGKLAFHSNIRVNLHHFLYEMARDESQFRRFKANSILTTRQRESFNLAVTFYKKTYINNKIDLIWSDSELAAFTVKLNNRVHNNDNDSKLVNTFNHILPVYKQTLWPQHHKQNTLWYNQLAPKLDKYGEQIQRALKQAFQSSLVTIKQHPIDIVYKAGIRQGAYTTGRTPHTTINSTDADYSGWAALEMIFHEVSHAVAVNYSSKLSLLIKAEFANSDIRVWHPILFYTVAQVVKQTISPEYSNYVSYATKNDLYVKGWEVNEAILIKYWQPYLDGEVTMEQAIKNMAKHYSK